MGNVRVEGGNSTEWVNGQPLIHEGRDTIGEGERERRDKGKGKGRERRDTCKGKGERGTVTGGGGREKETGNLCFIWSHL